MNDYTPRIALPYLSVAQAQKEMAHNAALNKLDVMTQPVVRGRQNTPPASFGNGEAFIVGDSPTGAWAGQSGKIAYYLGGWFFYTPFLGMRFFNLEKGTDVMYDGSGWQEYPGKLKLVALAEEPAAPAEGCVLFFMGGALKFKTASGQVYTITTSTI